MSESRKAVIDVRGLVKVYPGGTRAVDGIDFTVHEGEFFGFLGPNGAGKSTALKVLSTLLKKTSGQVSVAGYDVDHQAEQIRRSVGVAMQTAGLDDLAKAHDFLTLQGRLYGLRSSEARARSMELLDFIGLANVAQKKIGTFSGGMRRRLDLVATLVHEPKVLFLDEPTTGLDPQSRNTLWDHLRHLNTEEGVTIILTTQMMDEADRLCERLAIIDQGKIVAEGSPRALKEQVGGDVVTITIAEPETADEREQLVARAQEIADGQAYVSATAPVQDGLAVTVANGGAAVPELLRLLANSDIPVSNLSISSPTLDDVFLQHTGRTIRDEETGGDEMNNQFRPFLGLSDGR